MNTPKNTNSGLDYFLKFQKSIAARIIWPYSFEKDDLYRGRAFILSSILIGGLLFGFFALISATLLIIKENAWGLAIVDFMGLILCFSFLFIHRIKFGIRASITLLMFYVIGLAVILSVGPLSGGPAWLFAFAVLSGVLIGNYAALAAILMNAICLSVLGILISTGKYGNDFPFFNSPQAMITAGINFIVLNSIAAVSVSALVKGLFSIYKKKETLAYRLEEEKVQLIETKQSLELEIKDRKQTEKALLKTETKFRQIYNNILDIYYEASLDGEILEISPSIERYSQYKRKELIGKSLYDIYTNPEDRDKLIEIIFKKGNVRDYETNLTDKDGTQHLCSMNIELIKDNKGDPIKLVGIFRDITERKQADDALSSERNRIAGILEGTNAGTWNWNVQTGEVTLNQRWAAIMGRTLEDLKPININTWIGNVHPDDLPRANAMLDKHFSGETDYFDVIFRQPHKRGDWVWVNARGKVVEWSEDGKPLRMSGTHLDITELKKAETEKLMAQKVVGEQKQLALVGQVAGKIAHDFNNILGIVMGNTELALLDCQESKTKKILELIFEQTIRGKNLTKNLVAFAKDQEPKQEFFRINEKIDLVLNLMRKDLDGIELRKEERLGVPELLADPGMIEHALVNLIQNSIHALSMVEYPKITVRTYSRDNHICFEIEDNGCGISKENLENIYEPSFTLKGSKDETGSYKAGIKGTGYGMANVKKYIELHKGNISVESESSSGTKFTICLPVIKKELSIEEKIELRERIKHFEKYILLVEDETAISDVQYKILTKEPCNHKVDIAINGQVAMDLFNRNKYDFVSLDYILPGGINGMDVYHDIRKTNKTVPILFVSGNIEFLESIKELKQKDVYIDHLSKPCQNINYMNGINKLLEKTLAEQQ